VLGLEVKGTRYPCVQQHMGQPTAGLIDWHSAAA
jgi:hypothetical protein